MGNFSHRSTNIYQKDRGKRDDSSSTVAHGLLHLELLCTQELEQHRVRALFVAHHLHAPDQHGQSPPAQPARAGRRRWKATAGARWQGKGVAADGRVWFFLREIGQGQLLAASWGKRRGVRMGTDDGQREGSRTTEENRPRSDTSPLKSSTSEPRKMHMRLEIKFTNMNKSQRLNQSNRFLIKEER